MNDPHRMTCVLCPTLRSYVDEVSHGFLLVNDNGQPDVSGHVAAIPGL